MDKFKHSIVKIRRLPATHGLLAINILVFLWMVGTGVSALAPSGAELLKFGATQPGLVSDGDFWRLVTAGFVHVGFIHLFFNMWCLWNLGLLGEPLVGPLGLVGIYLLTEVTGNILSTAVNLHLGLNVIGAGASGAVFGIAGALILLLSNKRLPIPWIELKRIRGKVVQFALLNLAIGASTHFLATSIQIDNMAHLGGVASGLLVGFCLMPAMTSGRQNYLRRQLITFGGGAGILAILGFIFLYFH